VLNATNLSSIFIELLENLALCQISLQEYEAAEESLKMVLE